MNNISYITRLYLSNLTHVPNTNVISDRDKVVEMASDILQSRLYVSGWELSYTLCDIKYGRNLGSIAITTAKDNDCQKLVATSIFLLTGAPDCVTVRAQSFTKKSYRGRGIGRKAILKNMKYVNEVYPVGDFNYKYNCGYGIDGSYKFWESAIKESDKCELILS